MTLAFIQAACVAVTLVLIAIALSRIDRKQQVKRMHQMRKA